MKTIFVSAFICILMAGIAAEAQTQADAELVTSGHNDSTVTTSDHEQDDSKGSSDLESLDYTTAVDNCIAVATRPRPHNLPINYATDRCNSMKTKAHVQCVTHLLEKLPGKHISESMSNCTAMQTEVQISCMHHLGPMLSWVDARNTCLKVHTTYEINCMKPLLDHYSGTHLAWRQCRGSRNAIDAQEKCVDYFVNNRNPYRAFYNPNTITEDGLKGWEIYANDKCSQVVL